MNETHANQGPHHRRFENCYKLGKILGRGNFSVVYLATSIEDDTSWRDHENLTREANNHTSFINSNHTSPPPLPLISGLSHTTVAHEETDPFSKYNQGTEKKKQLDVAVKIICKRGLLPHQISRLHMEVDLLSQCHHENIVNLIEYFEDSLYIYMVMDLKTGGELFDRIVEYGYFLEEEAIFILRQIGKAVQYLHSKGIVHRDLKPENMLFGDDSEYAQICVADFGFARFVKDDEDLTTPCGTPGYVAPEIANSQTYNKAVDMWSLGVVMYTLLCGFPPFYSEDDEILLELIADGEYTFPDPYWQNISTSAKELIQHLLEKDPSKRYSAEEFLNHPWMKGKTVKLSTSQDNKLDPDVAPKREELKNILNKSIEVQRDGTTIKSASESTLWKRRQQSKGRVLSNSNPVPPALTGNDSPKISEMEIDE